MSKRAFLKTLAVSTWFWTSFKQWSTACRCVLKTRVSKRFLETCRKQWNPEGPKIKKKFEISSENENFKRATPTRPIFCGEILRLTFPRAKLWRQIFMTGQNSGRRVRRKIGRSFGRNFPGIFVLHLLCRMSHPNFSPNSSQFITPCLVTAPVTEISKFHLRELLGLGVPKGDRDVEKENFRHLDQKFRSRLRISSEIEFFLILGPSGNAGTACVSEC